MKIYRTGEEKYRLDFKRLGFRLSIDGCLCNVLIFCVDNEESIDDSNIDHITLEGYNVIPSDKIS